MNNDFLKKIFGLLSSNLSFPYYHGERRIDIFINFFLEEIIRQNTVYSDVEFIVPEFPIKIDETKDRAAHIDYLMFSRDKKTAILVELKTDDSSLDPKQLNIYLTPKDFNSVYKESLKIKLKRFADKKDTLHKKLETIKTLLLETCAIKVIVLKPTITLADKNLAAANADKLMYLALSQVEIQSKYQEEWNLLKEQVLLKLSTKINKGVERDL